MLKTTLYGAVAGGLLVAAAAAVSPLAAAPALPVAPQAEKNVTDVQHRHWRRHHRHHHHRHYHRRHYYDGYYYGPSYYYRPGPGIYFRAW